MKFITVSLFCCYYIHGKILRLQQCNRFDSDFSLVFQKMRLAATPIRIEKNVSLENCIKYCVVDPDCQSINVELTIGVCELLQTTTKTTEINDDAEWTHYETDPSKSEIGEVCETISPCPYDICEGECEPPGFTCKCLTNNYIGEKCDTYRGIGDSHLNPASTCDALLKQIPNLRDGCYWVNSMTVYKGYCTGSSTKVKDGEMKITYNHVIKTMPKLLKSWMFSIEIKPLCKPSTDFANIFHATTGGDMDVISNRIPGVWFSPGTTELYIEFPVNGTLYSLNIKKPLSLKSFTNLTIKHVLVEDIYKYYVLLGGNLVFTVINNQPGEFEQVKLYVSDLWHNPAAAIIRNLKYENL